jgi:hypothetical protein
MAEDAVECWLVDRASRDERLVQLVYATPDGEHSVTRERSIHLLRKRPATAAVDVPPEDLVAVGDPDTVDRYAEEATRMAERHDPNDEV